ncbi:MULTISPECIES: TetR/AcrR family transcriptional regulator [Oxalobacteraceae]|jgi:AcrR family transcriptional regulator|uniref:TetR/AcrR family transcriptional regulator n=1 Tax=Oxalobacteraceae TaxID=75682 RepID=UPI001FFEE8D2|nr:MULTISPECIES: TetR/AcrR family transcriptional regulator [Oxalobacteraceae]
MDTTLGRRERKRQQTADLLTEKAVELFEAHGYEAVTMEQIAAAADVAKGTLYNHFPVKEALLRHYFHQQIAAGAPKIGARLNRTPDVIERIRLVLRHAATWAERHRQYWPHYLHYRLSQSSRSPEERSGLEAVFTMLIGDAQRAGRLRGDRDTATLVHYFQYLYLAAITRWVGMPDTKLEDELMTMLDLFLTGAGKDAA